MTFLDSTIINPAGAGTSMAIPVPVGAASGVFAFASLCLDNSTTPLYNQNVTPPGSGWVNFVNFNNLSGEGKIFNFYKLLNASDSGSYTFSWSISSGFREGVCGLWSGRRFSGGDPITDYAAQETSADFTLGVSSPKIGNKDDLLGIGFNLAGGGWSSVSDMTIRENGSFLVLATQDNLTGPITTNKSFAYPGLDTAMKAALFSLADPPDPIKLQVGGYLLTETGVPLE